MTYDWISFTTDYGRSDGFVAECHGVIARLAPATRIIDVTHDIPPGDVSRGAAVLAQTVPSLPRAVHLAIVDPGVGTARRGIALRCADGSVLVGPDNGLLPPAARALGGVTEAMHLTEPSWFAATVSATFHGRDVFAPVAARLAVGADLTAAGDKITDPVLLPEPIVRSGPDFLEAEVRSVDRFGNIQLAVGREPLDALGPRLLVDGRAAVRTATFGDASHGALMVLIDSADFVAVAVNGGPAAAELAIGAGDVVRIERHADTS